MTAHPIKSSGYGGTKEDVVYAYRLQDERYTGMHTEPFLGSESEYTQRFPRGRSLVVRVKPDKPDVSAMLDEDQWREVKWRSLEEKPDKKPSLS